jgi:hypothetical protein
MKLVNPLIIGNIEQGLKYSIRDVAAERRRSDLAEVQVLIDYDRY